MFSRFGKTSEYDGRTDRHAYYWHASTTRYSVNAALLHTLHPKSFIVGARRVCSVYCVWGGGRAKNVF